MRDPEALAQAVEALEGPDRALADEVLFACGWQVNYDADDVAKWRTAGGCMVENEGGPDSWATFTDMLDWACWYPPGNKPFRDSWIDGHYRPNPLASLDAAMSLVPEHSLWSVGSNVEGLFAQLYVPFGVGYTGGEQPTVFAATPALALTAACLRALASEKGA